MMFKCSVIIFCTLIAANQAVDLSSFNKLVKLSIVFRHGDRMPYPYNYPNDPYKNAVIDPPRQTLNKAGAERARLLGTKLRNHYNWFLGRYDSNQVEVITSPIQRCIDTFTNVSQTLFPQTKVEGVKYSFKEGSKDKLIAVFYSCNQVFGNETQFEMKNPEDLQFMESLNGAMGVTLTNYFQVYLLQDYLKVMDEVGYPLPEWAKAAWPQLSQIQRKFWRLFIDNQAENAAGNLLHKIARDSSGAKLRSAPKVHLYAGHDVNVGELLGLLDAYDQVDFVNYCSYIAFEVYKPIFGPHFVEIYLDNNDASGRVQLDLPGCGYRCPVSNFLEYAEDFYLAENWCQ